MWTTFKNLWSDERWHATAIGLILAVVTQALALVSHKFGFDAQLADKIPGMANSLTLAIGAFVTVYVAAHAHAEHGENVGNGIADGLKAGGAVISSAFTAAAPADATTPAKPGSGI
jgi:hypothetical protein